MSLNSYLKIYDDNNLKNLNAQKNLLEETANKNITDLSAEGELAKKETEASYEGLINTQNVQRLINEKKVAETMANLGLSDSGLNRTQQTAVQLSHSNAVAQLQLQRQKKVDEIARLVQQQVGTVKTQLSQDLIKTQSAYEQNRMNWATNAYNSEIEAAQTYNKNMASSRNSIIDKIVAEDATDAQKQLYVDNHLAMYPDDDMFINWALDNGWERKEDAEGNVRYEYMGSDTQTTGNNVKDQNAYTDVNTGKIYLGVATSADDVGPAPTAQEIRSLKDAFNKNGLVGYWAKRRELVAKGVNTVEMDKAMEDAYGALWQVITSQSTHYESGNNIVNVVDDGGANWWGGIDKEVVLDVNGTKIGIDELYEQGQNAGIYKDVLNDYLKIYGTNVGKGFTNTSFGGYTAWNKGKTVAEKTENDQKNNWWYQFAKNWAGSAN